MHHFYYVGFVLLYHHVFLRQVNLILDVKAASEWKNGPFFAVFGDKMVVLAETNHCSHFSLLLKGFSIHFLYNFFLFSHLACIIF